MQAADDLTKLLDRVDHELLCRMMGPSEYST